MAEEEGEEEEMVTLKAEEEARSSIRVVTVVLQVI